MKSALAVAPQHDLASLCTTLENSGREGLMTLLAESNMGATAKHPRPRMAMTAYLMKEGCGLVNTQQLHSGMGGAAGDVSSLLPKVILRSGVATKLAFGFVIAFVTGSLLLACGMLLVYLSFRFDICRGGVERLLSSFGGASPSARDSRWRRRAAHGAHAPLRRAKGKVAASDEDEMSLSVPGPPPFGIEVLRNNTVVALEGKAAHVLRVGDRIISVDGHELDSRMTVQKAVDKRLKQHTFVVMRPKRVPAPTTSHSEAEDDDDDEDY